ncbi:4-hydroxy-tetrahydrodipicolinate synthase [Candidatus Bathyarchaeota archaeon]|nr:4-hydroxy-tetrahydrodipicolinate synthase [Candidatus Bathyarchaeota archaeon]
MAGITFGKGFLEAAKIKHDHRGVVVPMVTPFHDSGDLDEKALRRLTSYLIEKGVHVLFPAGSTGEGWSLTREERKRVFQVVVEEAAGRVPVYAGTGAITTREAVYLTRMAEDCGVDAIIAITPFYIAPTSDELYEHYKTITSATELHVFPYNNPFRTGVNLSADLVVRLSKIGNLIGIKDSSGNLALTTQFVNSTTSEFKVYQGRDDLFFPSLVIGASGLVAATGNLAPESVLEIYNAFTAGDWKRAQHAQNKISMLRRALGLGTFPAVIKEAMTIMGMPMGPARAPVGALTGGNRKKLQGILESRGLL